MKKLIVLGLAALSIMPMQAQTDPGDFTVDAQVRSRGEYRNGQGSLRSEGATPATFINDRVRVGLGWERQNLSVKVAAQHTGVWGDDSQTNNSNKGNISVNEAWAKLRFGKDGVGFLQLGRQALVYDDERLLGGLDWAATGRSHDALKIGYEKGEHRLHGIIAYNQNEEKRIGNTYDGVAVYKNMQTLWYHYGTTTPLGISLIFMNQGVENVQQAKTHYMQTLGFYGNGKFGDGFSANAAFYYQFGRDKNDKSVSAYMASVGLKYQFMPELSLAVGDDYISGTGSDSEKNNTFNVLYGTHHKFYGAMDYFNNTTMPVRGLNDLNATLAYKPSKKVDLSGTYHFFSIARELQPNSDLGKSLGSELDFQVNWRIQQFVTLQAGYSMMLASETMESIKGGSHDSWQDWGWVSLNINPTIFSTKHRK